MPPKAAAPQQSLLSKCFMKKKYGQVTKEEFPELPTVLHWVRQVLAIVVGLACGVIGAQGYQGFAAFLVATMVLPLVWYGSMLNVNQDDFDGELTKEGLSSAFGLFLMCWVTTFSAMHHPDV